jgi:hypothetical protein
MTKSDFTSIIMNEKLKNLVYSQLIYAQGKINSFHLSQLKTYEIYHEPLRKYFIDNYNGKKPTQTDNLSFLLLLTYSKEMIERFTNFQDLKIYFNNENEESDFEDCGFEIDEYMQTTCICNEPLKYIHKFRNKQTGVFINIGSVCNERYGLISKNDPNYISTERKIKEAKERIKEKAEGLPEGFYKQERIEKKRKREQEKDIKREKNNEEKELKKMIKEENLSKKINKFIKNKLIKMNKNNPGNFILSKCLFCKKEDVIHNISRKICICNVCIPEKQMKNKIKINNEILNLHTTFCRNLCFCSFVFNFNLKKNKIKINNEIINLVKIDNCSNCDTDFISKNNSELCNKCIKEWKIKICNFKGCSSKFCLDINNNDNYCPDCDEKIVNCITCNIKVYKEIASKNSGRCNICDIRFISKLIVIICNDCEEQFEVPEKENYRKYCSGCYKNNLSSHNCIICNNKFNKLPDETWRKMCRDCYYKNKS